MSLTRMAAAEAVGTALLLAIVVGSGIMGERLAQGNMAVALLANSLATGAGLYALINIFEPVSGAHFNPVVSGVSVWDGRLSGYHGIVYVLAQVSGAFGGVAAAHMMFGLPIVQVSSHMRPTLGEGFGDSPTRWQSVRAESWLQPREHPAPTLPRKVEPARQLPACHIQLPVILKFDCLE